ncbi:hypothetical protein F5Y13DRAFT_197079 [Hypoxylon sp. FL1857]|nr:hypothetical protein F5Y13DRAFT_197079 [Hypoxylon sp. FL1857]
MAAPSHFIRYSPEELLRIRKSAAPDTEFIPSVLLSHELLKSEPTNWRSLLAKPVIGCWLAAREREPNFFLDGYTEERNEWVVVLEVPDAQNVTIELKQLDDNGYTITVCRPGAPLRLADGTFDVLELLEGYACSFRSNVRVQIKVEDWISRLEKSGVTRYQLQSSRGHRYWIDAVLRQFQGFIENELPNLDNETEMLHVWKSGRELNVEVEDIMAGLFLPMRCPKRSPIPPKPQMFWRETQTPLHWIRNISCSRPHLDDERGQPGGGEAANRTETRGSSTSQLNHAAIRANTPFESQSRQHSMIGGQSRVKSNAAAWQRFAEQHH